MQLPERGSSRDDVLARMRERTRADAAVERVRVRTRLFEIYQEMQHSVHRAEVLRDEVIPRFEETLEDLLALVVTPSDLSKTTVLLNDEDLVR